MDRRTRFVLLIAASLTLLSFLIYRISRPTGVTVITGAVLREDTDPHKQRPIEKTTITASAGESSGETRSDASGLFRLRLNPPVELGQPVRLVFHHADYHPFETTMLAEDQIHVVRLKPTSDEGVKQTAIANVRVRYALKSTSTVDVGSIARTFDVVNIGNVPCEGQRPCSPDGKWKATEGSLSLDAENSKQYRNVRVSCIAGPCPFTKIVSDKFSRGGDSVSVTVRNWSDRVTYLLEAEVTQVMAIDMIRRSYPVIFGRSMNFTLPATAQGPSIEAEVDGSEIVFPLGPSLILSWADCKLEVGADRTKLYRCALKPKYRFE